MPADQFNCPTCQTLLRLAEPLPSGAKVKCPKCGTVFAAEGSPPSVEPLPLTPTEFTSEKPPLTEPARRPVRSDDVPRYDGGYSEGEAQEPDLGRNGLAGLPRRDYRIEAGEWFHYAGAHYSSVVGPMIGYFFVDVLIGMALGFIPILGPLANLVIQPALSAGYVVVALKQLKGKKWEFGDFFGGFKAFGSLFANVWLSGFLILACLIPGIIVLGVTIAIGAKSNFPPVIILGVLVLLANVILAWAYVGASLQMFCVPLIIDRNLGPIEAMQGAWALARGHTWGVFGMIILLGLINLGGVLLCFIGVIFAIPFTTLAQVAGYLLIAGRKPPVEPSPYPHETDYPGHARDDWRDNR